jgi:hypothetical protein
MLKKTTSEEEHTTVPSPQKVKKQSNFLKRGSKSSYNPLESIKTEKKDKKVPAKHSYG